MLHTILISLMLAAVPGTEFVGADDATKSLSVARSHLLHGRYEEAADGFGKLVTDEKLGVRAALGLSDCHAEIGKLGAAAEVVETALQRMPDQPDLLARLAELSLVRGLHAQGIELSRRALTIQQDHLPARWVAAQLADARGDSDAALLGYDWFVRFYNGHEVNDVESLIIIGQAAAEHAARALRGKNQSEQLSAVLSSMYDAAAESDADYWWARYHSGRLFLEKYRKGDAIKDLNRALAINPKAAVVHVALGVAALNDYDLDTGHEHANRALAVNPGLPAARQLKADLFMARDQFAEAYAELDHARETNPIDEETLARVAACMLFTRRTAEFNRLCEEVQSRNQRPVIFYSRLAERLEDHRRFDIAEAYFERAIALGFDRPAPRTGLGMLYMRIGNEAEAAKTLESAFEMDPFNVRTKNMLEVLDQLKSYDTIETEHFRIKVDGKLDGLQGKYAAKYLEEVFGELTERFDFRPADRIQIEIFNKGRGQSAHQWFSARTVGLPWIGTVGACTGKVVAMASPHGVEKPFNWARVLKHEVVHVITLQQTRFQIPHWFTEALAVQAEGYPRPQVWNQLLLERVPTGNLLNLDTINLAFARPKSPLDWQMAYCQSELYAEFMQTQFGAASTARLLDAYRDGLGTTEAVEKVFQVSKSEFEERYVEHVKHVASKLRSGPVEPPMAFAELERALAADPQNPDLAARLADEHLKRRNYPKARELASKATQLKKNHPLGSYMLARLSMVVGDTDRALELLEPALDRANPDPRILELLADLKIRGKQFQEARSLYELGRKQSPSESKWVAGLARVALVTDNRAALREALESLSLLEADDPSPRKKLASMAADDKDWARAAQYAWRTLHIDVADAEAHELLAKACLGQEKWVDAVDEFLTLRQLRPKDNSVVLELAEALDKAGQRGKAIETMKELLANDPENSQARELLEKLESRGF